MYQNSILKAAKAKSRHIPKGRKRILKNLVSKAVFLLSFVHNNNAGNLLHRHSISHVNIFAK